MTTGKAIALTRAVLIKMYVGNPVSELVGASPGARH